MSNQITKFLGFDLTVDSTALKNPNPQEWYTKTYTDEDIAGNFRVIPGVKNSTKVATVKFGSILKAEANNFDASYSSSKLSAVTMSVTAVQAQSEVGKKELESSFLSDSMAAGSTNWTVQAFMNYYWDVMSKEIKDEIAQIRWKGDTTNTGFTGSLAYLALVDGYEKRLLADANVVDVAAASAITTSNVITEMTKVLQALPVRLKNKKADLRFLVAADVAEALELSQYTVNSNRTTNGLEFAGIKVIPQDHMTAGRMALSLRDNFVYLFDGISDIEELRAINLAHTTADNVIRTAADMKIGFGITNPEEIVFYS